MIHSGLGIITNNGKICLPPDLVEQLTNGNTSLLYGLYYPKTSSLKGYEDVTIKYDLMITPIHYRFWSRSARLLIHLKHKPGSFNHISDFFKEKKVSVIHAEGSRSAHRYGTWCMHIAFENLSENLTYDNNREIYSETKDALKRFIQEVTENCGDFLFSQKNNYDLNHSIIGWPNSALAHFNNYYVNCFVNNASEDRFLSKPFEFYSYNDGELQTDKSDLKSILKYESRNDSCTLLDSIVYAELDTRAMNMRIAIIPKEIKKRFFEFGISYERNGIPDSCVGIINCITKSFPEKYNIWRLANQVQLSSNAGDEGKIVMLIEDLEPCEDTNEYLTKAEAILKKVDQSDLPKNVKLLNPLISPITRKKISKRIEKQKNIATDYKYDVFLSYSERNKSYADQIYEKLNNENISCFKAGEFIKGGDEFADYIRKALINSREMCLLCSNESIKSKWVDTEWGAAWALELHIVPITLQIRISQLPQRLRGKHAIDFSDIDKYIQQVKERKEDNKLMYFESIYG